jgi:hypothetical protein
MLSTKHINYLKWRKAYILVQSRDHLTEQGLTKIKRLKFTMNRLSVSPHNMEASVVI